LPLPPLVWGGECKEKGENHMVQEKGSLTEHQAK